MFEVLGVCGKLWQFAHTPEPDVQAEHIYMSIFSYSHSATYWQQEMTHFILSCIPPSRLTRSTSNVVRKALGPRWCYIVKLLSFHLNGVCCGDAANVECFAPWRKKRCNSTPHSQIFSTISPVWEDSQPEDIYMPILSHSHSATSWPHQRSLMWPTSSNLLSNLNWCLHLIYSNITYNLRVFSSAA